MNEHTHFANFDKMPPGMVEGMLFDAAKSEKDGFIFVCTKGIISHTEPNPGAQFTMSVKDPISVAIAMWNMAITFNKVDRVLEVCNDFEKIARIVRLNIDIETRKRRAGN